MATMDASARSRVPRGLGQVSGSTESSLVIGWQVTPAGDPVFWLDPKAKAGSQRADDLVTVAPRNMGSHTVVIAQSGSGKSTFLSRLIEELLLRTKARCVVFDPNADFWKANEVADASLWDEASYDRMQGRGMLPHESTRRQFAASWSRVGIRVLTAGAKARQPPYQQLQAWWPALPAELFAEGLNPFQRSEVYQCHSFVGAVAGLREPAGRKRRKQEDLIGRAERLFKLGKRDGQEFARTVRDEFAGDDNASTVFMSSLIITGTFGMFGRGKRVDSLIERAQDALNYVSEETGRFYFSRARDYKEAGILATSPAYTASSERLDIVDLPSLPDRDVRFLMVNALLGEEWTRAKLAWDRALEEPPENDERVPTFIVLEEAHNLIPAEASGQQETILRERFRTIAAEGRKYGLFLILVSQRPDKLDPLVVSECENKALLRLDSEAVLEVTRRLLGLEAISPRTLDRCLDFGIGRVLLIGRWAPREGRLLYAAARRTVEGGRNLRPEYWAVARQSVRAKAPTAGTRRSPKRPGTQIKNNSIEFRRSTAEVGSSIVTHNSSPRSAEHNPARSS